MGALGERTRVEPKVKFIVSYIGVDMSSGASSGWAPFRSRKEADLHMDMVSKVFDFQTMFVAEIVDQYE